MLINACAYVDPVSTSQSYELNEHKQKQKHKKNELVRFSCAYAYAYAYALVYSEPFNVFAVFTCSHETQEPG